jgi:hypothetical protein
MTSIFLVAHLLAQRTTLPEEGPLSELKLTFHSGMYAQISSYDPWTSLAFCTDLT